MAYHNLDSAKYPDLHPTAPVRYVEMQATTQAPLVAVPAQPVYYQPEGVAYAEIPYATPDATAYAQEPIETAPPVALPVSNNNNVPAVFIPPALTPDEFEAVLKRQVRFRGCKYFRESKVFVKANLFKLMVITLWWGVLLMVLGCRIHRIGDDGSYYGGYSNYYSSEPSGSYSPPSDSSSGSYYSGSYSGSYSSGYNGEDGASAASSNYYSQPIQSRFVLQMALMSLLSILVGVPAMAGMFSATFNAMKTNGPIRFKDFFSCFSCRYYCRLIPLSVTLKVVTGLLSMLVFPAIWFGFATMFAVPLHREHQFLGVCKSISVSSMIFHRYFCKLLGFFFWNALLQVVGFCFLGVGLLFTIPLSFVAFCYCYNDLIGVNGMPILIMEPEAA